MSSLFVWSVGTVINRAWRLIPSVFREGTVGRWASELSARDRILKEFGSSPVFFLQPATNENISQIACGKGDGYYLSRLKDGQINLHFVPLEIIQREDLLDGQDIPSFGFSGYITFEPQATELFQMPLNMLVLNIKYKGQQVSLIDLFPQMGMTLQARGFSDERIFYNSTLFLKHRSSNERFVVKFMPPGGMDY